MSFVSAPMNSFCQDTEVSSHRPVRPIKPSESRHIRVAGSQVDELPMGSLKFRYNPALLLLSAKNVKQLSSCLVLLGGGKLGYLTKYVVKSIVYYDLS